MNIGDKLKLLRQQKNLTQEEMADRCELSKGFISQVERDLASPSIQTLADMLECLGVSLQSFFSDTQNEKIVFSKDDMFVKEDEEFLKGDITWLVPSAQKNTMEPILISLGENGQSQEIPPHEGEEFGYVLQGNITLIIGEKSYKVNQGESFSVHPLSPHHLINKGKRTAKILWISTPPIF